MFVALSAIAPNVVVLDIVRFLLGIAIGISIVAAPLYVAESTPARIRGASVAAYQVATVAGIVITYFVNWGLSGGGHWRWMLGLSAIPAALVLIPLLRLPDTPRWYVLKGQTERAVEVMATTDPDVDPRRRSLPWRPRSPRRAVDRRVPCCASRTPAPRSSSSASASSARSPASTP